MREKEIRQGQIGHLVEAITTTTQCVDAISSTLTFHTLSLLISSLDSVRNTCLRQKSIHTQHYFLVVLHLCALARTTRLQTSAGVSLIIVLNANSRPLISALIIVASPGATTP